MSVTESGRTANDEDGRLTVLSGAAEGWRASDHSRFRCTRSGRPEETTRTSIRFVSDRRDTFPWQDSTPIIRADRRGRPRLAALLRRPPERARSPAADQGPGDPSWWSRPRQSVRPYYAEILRAEGLNEFAVVDAADARRRDARRLPGRRAGADLGDRRAGLRADRLGRSRRQPDRHAARRQLAGLLGLGGDGGHARNGYLEVDTASSRRRHHGGHDAVSTAPRTADAVTDATHRRDALRERRGSAPRSRRDAAPRRHARRSGRRVHLRPGALGRRHAAGQPAWAGQKRDGEIDPIRVRRPLLPATGST